MKKQDKVFDVFRRNQHKLEERPSLQTWNKLERRLDQKGPRQGKASFSIFSIMMMAAALVGIVFFVSSLSTISNRSIQQKSMVIYEHVPSDNKTALEFAQEQAFREQYQDILNTKVAEGSTGRLLVANKAVRPFLLPKRG